MTMTDQEVKLKEYMITDFVPTLHRALYASNPSGWYEKIRPLDVD